MTAQEWNKRFAALNSVPHDGKANQDALKSYYTQIISSKPLHYKNPDDYPSSVQPVAPVAPVVPSNPQGNTAQSLINNIRFNLDLLEKLN